MAKRPIEPSRQVSAALAIIEEHLGRFVIVCEPTAKAQSRKSLVFILGHPQPFSTKGHYLTERQREMLAEALVATDPEAEDE